MARRGGWCALCNATFADPLRHQGSERHRKAAFRASHPLGSRKSPRTIERRRAVLRFVPDVGQDYLRVRSHRRRRPLDGPRRSVKVRHYWRRRDYSIGERVREAAALRADIRDLIRKYPEQAAAYFAAVRRAAR